MLITGHMQKIIAVRGYSKRGCPSAIRPSVRPLHFLVYVIMLITGHMQKIIQIYPCLLKLSRKQDTILKIGDFSTKN
jgi:hypothetical protein